MSLTLGAPATQERPSAPLDLLRRRLTGAVHTPDEASYDALVTPWNLAVPMRPAAVVTSGRRMTPARPAGPTTRRPSRG